MGKIDTTKIKGYADMSAEQKLAALEALELEEPDYSGYVRKDIFDKTASELSVLKKEYNKKLTADELKAKEDAERQEKLQSDYDALLKKVTISENKAKLLALGYEESLANETAEAMVNGNLEKVFENQKIHLDSVEKKIREEVLVNTPKPKGGNGKGMSIEDIMKIQDPVERQSAIAQNIDLFEEKE